MTSTTDIANLILSNTALKQYFEGVRTSIDARINAVADRWQDHSAFFYVDQTTGSDANDGLTEDTPIASIDLAIRRTPHRGLCTIYLRGNYTTEARYRPLGRGVTIFGCDQNWGVETTTIPANRPNITIGFKVRDDGVFELHGVQSEYGGFFVVRRCNITMPSQDDFDESGGTYHTASCSLLSRYAARSGPATALYMVYCDFDITANPFGYILSTGSGYTLNVDVVTMPNSIQGRIHPLIPANSNPADYGHMISTNLSAL